jgi:hypothetical protein
MPFDTMIAVLSGLLLIWVFSRWLLARHKRAVVQHAEEVGKAKAQEVAQHIEEISKEKAKASLAMEWSLMQTIVASPDTISVNERTPGSIPVLVGENTVMTDDGPRSVPMICWVKVH